MWRKQLTTPLDVVGPATDAGLFLLPDEDGSRANETRASVINAGSGNSGLGNREDPDPLFVRQAARNSREELL